MIRQHDRSCLLWRTSNRLDNVDRLSWFVNGDRSSLLHSSFVLARLNSWSVGSLIGSDKRSIYLNYPPYLMLLCFLIGSISSCQLPDIKCILFPCMIWNSKMIGTVKDVYYNTIKDSTWKRTTRKTKLFKLQNIYYIIRYLQLVPSGPTIKLEWYRED